MGEQVSGWGGRLGDDWKSRRALLAGMGSAALGALGGAAVSAQAPVPVARAADESILDKWLRSKKATLGVDLSNPPTRFRDPQTGKPAGYAIELVERMLSALGVTPEYVEVPFSQYFAALAAGRFDMVGTFVTILPTRALQGLFADFPCHYESDLVYLRPGLSVRNVEQLNDRRYKLAVQQGTSAEYSSRLLFPNAQFLTFQQTTEVSEAVGLGHADAAVSAEQDVPKVLKVSPKVTYHRATAYTDANTFLMPLGDYKLQAWINTWLRYQANHNLDRYLWLKWGGADLVSQYHVPINVVGAGGQPVPVTAV